MNTKIDIILPNYNKETYLEETINSVLKQTYKDWQLFIVDDCSTDNSRKILKKYQELELIEFQLVLLLIALKLLTLVYYLDNSACAAASLATGTRKGEQDT